MAREALERTTAICLALPDATCERESQHATFRAGKKVFAYFLDDHHGDGIVAVCVKVDRPAAVALSKKEPARFYLPAYIWARGWVGVRLDQKRVDWKDVAARIAKSHASATTKRAGASAKAKSKPARKAPARHSPR